MSSHSTTRPFFFLLALTATLLSPVLAGEWKEVLTRSGSIKDTTVGGGRAKAPSITSGPFGFEVKGKSIRLSWNTEPDGRGPDFRIEIEKLIPQNNGGNRWQRVAVIGRTHENTKEAKALDSGPGSYRLFVVGHSMKYGVAVESLDPDSK